MTNEPLTQALRMAERLLHLLNQLHDDDPGDDESRVAPRLCRARTHAQHLVAELKEIA